MSKQKTIAVSKQIYRQAKRDAVRLGITVTQYMEEALLARIERRDISGAVSQAQIDELNELLDSLREATAHFRANPGPNGEKSNES